MGLGEILPRLPRSLRVLVSIVYGKSASLFTEDFASQHFEVKYLFSLALSTQETNLEALQTSNFRITGRTDSAATIARCQLCATFVVVKVESKLMSDCRMSQSGQHSSGSQGQM